jgi:hypothetical protein
VTGATVNHHPEYHQPLDNSVHVAERASGARAETHNHEGNTKLLPWLIFTSVLSGFSLATAIFVLIEFAQIQNDMARMATHLMSNDALLLRERIIQPGDLYHGPEGNLEYGRKDQPRK